MSLDEARVAEYKGTHLCCVNAAAKELSPSTARLAEREHIIRESWVRAMEAKLVRDQLDRCYQTEGVNHMESCKDLRERYLDMLRENRVCHLNTMCPLPDAHARPVSCR